ncbi:MAG: T9SS type A sorting domain-containing protein [Flavobacteriaceae bacterium]|jgi:hypothetical protein|nr:T9SS type A sorting domain-containing protein [Flavobacteriaceae bacterium]
MKTIYLLLVVAVTFVFTAAQENLVKNPGFEEGQKEWAVGGIDDSKYTILPKIDTEGPHGGDNSVSYDDIEVTTGLYQDIPVIAEESYTLTFWHKISTVPGKNGSGARIWSAFLDSGGHFIPLNEERSNDPLRNNNKYLSKTADWTQHTVNFTAPAGAVALRLAARAYTKSIVYFDDFSLTKNSLSVEDITISENKAILSNTLISDQIFVLLDGKSKVDFYSANGSRVKSVTVTSHEAINTSDLQPGVYVVRVVNEGKSETVKVIKK